jgi:hypothetical protein
MNNGNFNSLGYFYKNPNTNKDEEEEESSPYTPKHTRTFGGQG